MSLFSDLYVGVSGLQTSQEALNVVAHNITNTDTEGYVRQQVSQGTREYNRISMSITGVAQKQTGLGVYIPEVRQVRDRFLDESYREEIGRQGFYDTAYAGINEIEEILGELDGATFYESMNDLWSSIEELVKDPSSEVCQSMFVQYAQSFVEAASNVYDDLSKYQDKLDVKVKNDVDRINEIGHGIYSLNNQIRAIESGGVENANDLRDQRNQLLDELAGLAKISYRDDAYGNVLVKVESHDFVIMNRVNEMAYQINEETGFLDCFWPDSAKSEYNADGKKVYFPETASVFNFEVEISSALDTDLGELKSAVLARGDHRGNWSDLIGEKEYDNVKDSLLMNVMAEFDGLVRNVVTSVNGVLAANSDPANNYLCDADGNPIQLFTRVACDDVTRPETIDESLVSEDGSTEYTKYFVKESSSKRVDGCWHVRETATGKELGIYNQNSEGVYVSDSSAWFSVPNISVNQDLLQYPTHLGFKRPDGSVDYETARQLEDAFSDKKFTLNPELTNPISIVEYYSNLVAQVANSGNVYKSLKENQELTVESVESTRQGAIGVSSDEELSNMIKFQNAYNASSRFINVIDECMEHLINTLGR